MTRTSRIVVESMIAVALTSWGCAGRINDGIWQPVTGRSYTTDIGTVIHDSTWLFAFVESIHLMGLALTGGALLLVDLRLLGLSLSDESAAEIGREAQPLLVGSLVVMLISGVLLYLSEATKFYSQGFWDSAEFPFIFKMLFLILAIVFTFTIRRRTLASDPSQVRPIWYKAVGLTSMILWLGVAVGGRGIGFY